MRYQITAPCHRGFTLVELIVTITIIVILAGLVIGGFGFARDKQALETARIQIALLSKGIDEYRLDMGAYPGSGAPNDFGGNATLTAGLEASRVLYQALFFEGWSFIQNNNKLNNTAATSIYVVELDPTNNRQGWTDLVTTPNPPNTALIRDPWGRPYRYRLGNHAVNPDFDLWSSGKDGRTLPGNNGNYNINAPDNRDDVRNF